MVVYVFTAGRPEHPIRNGSGERAVRRCPWREVIRLRPLRDVDQVEPRLADLLPTRGDRLVPLQPPRDLGRGPSAWEADLHLSYPIRVSPRSRLNVIFDVFNVFNRQAPASLDRRYNIVQDGPSAGVPENLCNGDGGLVTLPGTLEPRGQLADPRATATNPDYPKKGSGRLWESTAFTEPRSLRLGLRWTF
jgi:hypothetical protein